MRTEAATATQCFDTPAKRNSVGNISAVYPRGSLSQQVNGSNCTPLRNDQAWTLISSYYDNGGSNASRLQTGVVRFSMFSYGAAPVNSVTLQVQYFGLCTSGSSSVGLQAFGGASNILDRGTIASTDNTIKNRNITIPVTWQRDNAKYGYNTWVSNYDLRALAPQNAGSQISCRMRVISQTAGVNLTFTEDNNNSSAYNETNQRFNANNWASSQKRFLGPGGATTVSAYSLFSNLGAGVELEYAIPFSPACSVNTTRAVYLRIYDMDNPTSNVVGTPQPGQAQSSAWGEPQMRLYNETTGQEVRFRTGGSGIGTSPVIAVGNDEYRDYEVTIEPGHRYTWVFWNVQANNGVQVWMPYSEVNAGGATDCTAPNPQPTPTYNHIIDLTQSGLIAESVGNYRASPGTQFTLNSRVTNTGTGTSSAYGHRIGAVTGVATAGVYPELSTSGFIPIASPPNNSAGGSARPNSIGWGWAASVNPGLSQGASKTNTISFTVSSSATDGSVQCFQAAANPQSSSNQTIFGSQRICITVRTQGGGGGGGGSSVSCSSTTIPATVPSGSTFTASVAITSTVNTTLTSLTRSINNGPSASAISGTQNLTANTPRTFQLNGQTTNGTEPFIIRWSGVSALGAFTCENTIVLSGGPTPQLPPECSVLPLQGGQNAEIRLRVTIRNRNTSGDLLVTGSTWSTTEASQNNGVGELGSDDTILNSSGGGLTIAAGQERTILSPIIRFGTYGRRDYSWQITHNGVGGALNCGPSTVSVYRQPYARLYGNDIISGCGSTTPTRGNYYLSSGTGSVHSRFRGTAAELAVFATGQNIGILPGSQNLDRTNASELAFSNVGTAPNNGIFGTPLTDSANLCAESLWSDTAVGTNIAPSSLVDLTDTPSGIYRYTSDSPLQLYASRGIPDGRRITIYVDGNVIIGNPAINFTGPQPTGDGTNPQIAYQNSSWGNVDEIPLFQLIVRGNLYIDNNVNRIDGLYAAYEKAGFTGPSGQIHTCAEINQDPVTNRFGVDLYYNPAGNKDFNLLGIVDGGRCKYRLTINGAFIAKQALLQRIAYSHAVEGPIGEFSYNLTPNNPGQVTAAEVFNFSPELYLALLGSTGGGPAVPTLPANGSYDSIVSPPPAF